VADIQRVSRNSRHASGYTADLSSLEPVRRLAADVLQDNPQLAALVNNAGVLRPREGAAQVISVAVCVCYGSGAACGARGGCLAATTSVMCLCQT